MFSQPKLYKNDTLNFMINQLLTNSGEDPFYPADIPEVPDNLINLKPNRLTPGGEHKTEKGVEYWLDEDLFIHCVSMSDKENQYIDIGFCKADIALSDNNYYSLMPYVSKADNDANGEIAVIISPLGSWSTSYNNQFADFTFNLETAAGAFYSDKYILSSDWFSKTTSGQDYMIDLNIKKGSLWKKGQEIIFKIGFVKQTVTTVATYTFNNYSEEDYATNVDIDINNSNVSYQFNEALPYRPGPTGYSSALTTTPALTKTGSHYYILDGTPVQYNNADAQSYLRIKIQEYTYSPFSGVILSGLFTNTFNGGGTGKLIWGHGRFVPRTQYLNMNIATICNIQGKSGVSYPITEAINNLRIIEVTAVDAE